MISVSWNAAGPGEHSIYAVATDNDGESATSETITTTVTEPLPDIEPPVVQVTATPANVSVGNDVTITATVLDDSDITSSALVITLPDGTTTTFTLVDNQRIYTASSAGFYTATITATDAEGNTGTDSTIFSVYDGTNDNPPEVDLHDDVEFECQEIAADLYDIIGSATDDGGTVHYKLMVKEKGCGKWETLAEGTTDSFTNQSIVAFDPTIHRNGTFDVKLWAEDLTGQTDEMGGCLLVNGRMKVGQASIGGIDFNIPELGYPLMAGRVYDSRKKANGDFGIGWTLSTGDIRLEESCEPGKEWQQVPQGGGSIMNPFVTYLLQEQKSHHITVTYPGGETDEFQMQISPTSSFLQPFDQVNVSYQGLPGTHSELEALADTTLWVIGNVDQPVTLADSNYVEYNPDRYKLTRLDGTVIILNQDSGIEQVIDRNGNTLAFTEDGIVHSTGKSIEFLRDGEGRITQITDPKGQTIRYEYDGYGDLVSVTDQEGYVTRFTYENTHDLQDIIDPRGVRATRNEYDDDGRLVATIDPEGRRIEFDHDIDARMEIVRDRLQNPTIYHYDDHGNKGYEDQSSTCKSGISLKSR